MKAMYLYASKNKITGVNLQAILNLALENSSKMADVLATASKQPRLPQVQERPFPIMKIAGKS